MDDKIQEINGHLIAVSPAGQWSVVNTDGKIISTHSQKYEAMRTAQDAPQFKWKSVKLVSCMWGIRLD